MDKRRKVKYVNLHSSPFIPGVGELTTSLPPSTRTVDMDMYMDNAGIYVEVRHAAGKYVGIVPYTNVKIFTLEENE